MQLSTLVLKEEDSSSYKKLVARVDVHVKFYWPIIKLFLITWLLRLVQVTKPCPFLLSLDHRLEISNALPWLGRRPCNSVRWLVGGPALPCSVWWVEDLQLLGGRGEGRGPSPLFARFGQRSKCGVYLLSSSLSAAVKLFSNCKGTTVPYFFITLSIYFFITLEIFCTFMLLYQLYNIISYTSIVLLHS